MPFLSLSSSLPSSFTTITNTNTTTTLIIMIIVNTMNSISIVTQCSGVCKQSRPQCLVYLSLQICSPGRLVSFFWNPAIPVFGSIWYSKSDLINLMSLCHILPMVSQKPNSKENQNIKSIIVLTEQNPWHKRLNPGLQYFTLSPSLLVFPPLLCRLELLTDWAATHDAGEKPKHLFCGCCCTARDTLLGVFSDKLGLDRRSGNR